MTQFSQNAEKYLSSSIHSTGDSLARLIDNSQPQKDWQVLDIATGAGHTALHFAPYVSRVIASDVEPTMLVTARKHHLERGASNIEYCQHTSEWLPFADASFDCVTCRIAAHHFSDISTFIKESRRVLRMGGILAIADNIISGEPEIAQYVNVAEKFRDASHQWAYSKDDWETFLFSANLEIISVETLKKRVNLADWTYRAGVVGDEAIRLEALIRCAPSSPLEWLNVKPEKSQTDFWLEEIVIIGKKHK